MADDPSEKTEEAAACNCAREEPELMRRMAKTVGADHLLKGVERQLAGERCQACTELEACKVWLEITAIRGAVRAPKFCRNAKLFEELANDEQSLTI